MTHAEANIKARQSARHLQVRVQIELAVIVINKALDIIKEKRYGVVKDKESVQDVNDER